MKICPNCGNKVADEALFCNNCGTNMAGVESVAEVNSNSAAASNASEATPNTDAQGFQGQFSQSQVFQGQPNVARPAYVPHYDPADHTAEFDPRDIADNKLFAVLPYFASLLGVVIALLVPESAYARFHAKNAIRLFIAMVLAAIPSIVPILGWIVTCILGIIIFVIHIIAIVSVFKGQAKELPIIGSISFLK